MFNRTLFFWRLGGLILLGSLLAWWLYGHIFDWYTSYSTIIPFILFPFCFSLAHNAIHKLPLKLTKLFAWVGGLWLIFTLYSFFALIVFAILAFVFSLTHNALLWETLAAPISAMLGLVVLLAIGRGMWKAFHPIYRHITIASPKITTSYTIAFLTDLHFSPILSHYYGKTLVHRLNQLHADSNLIGGDLIDAHLDFVLRDGAYKALQGLTAPTYAVYGNHDYFDSDIVTEKEAFSTIHFLKNEHINLQGNITLTGLNDYLHEPTNDLMPPQAGAYNILVDHEPLRIYPASKAGYDLYLAGHTHGGQFFPVTQITRRLFPLSYGQKQFGNLTAIVSSGYGFWGMPMRTGPLPEIVVLHFQPQKQ